MIPPAPCKDCTCREPGCHAGCAEYKKWKAINAEKLKRNFDAQKDYVFWRDRAIKKRRKK